jgi:hypothetical protein
MTSTIRTAAARGYRCGECGVTAPAPSVDEPLDFTAAAVHRPGCAVGTALDCVIADDVAWLRSHRSPRTGGAPPSCPSSTSSPPSGSTSPPADGGCTCAATPTGSPA